MTKQAHLCVNVQLPPQRPQRGHQLLRLAVDAHPHAVDKHLGRGAWGRGWGEGVMSVSSCAVVAYEETKRYKR